MIMTLLLTFSVCSGALQHFFFIIEYKNERRKWLWTDVSFVLLMVGRCIWFNKRILSLNETELVLWQGSRGVRRQVSLPWSPRSIPLDISITNYIRNSARFFALVSFGIFILKFSLAQKERAAFNERELFSLAPLEELFKSRDDFSRPPRGGVIEGWGLSDMNILCAPEFLLKYHQSVLRFTIESKKSATCFSSSSFSLRKRKKRA